MVTLAAFFINIFSYDMAWASQDPVGLPSVASDGTGARAAPVSRRQLALDTFTLPSYLGTVQYAYPADRGSADTVIHIQDAHCNYAAQKKISEIIGYLHAEYGVSIVNLEGGSGDYDVSVFTSIADSGIREKVSDSFVGRGMVTGSEYFAINAPEAVTLWGIEDPKLYVENLKVYRDSLAHKERAQEHFKALSYILTNLKMRVYTKDLLEFDAKYAQYKAENLQFKEYLGYLTAAAKRYGIAIRSFPNLFLLDQALDEEARLDIKKANEERDELIDRFQKILARASMEELIVKTVEFRSDRLPQHEYYAYLSQKARAVGVDMGGYPELQKYVVYVSMYGAIDKTKITAELQILEDGMRSTLCATDEQRELAGLSKNLSILKNIFGLSLNKGDYAYYKANSGSFDMRRYVGFIDKEAPLYKIDARPDAGIEQVDEWRRDMARFYELSFMRDDAFIKNLRFADEPAPVAAPAAAPAASAKKARATVVVTGGFHTDNLCELLKKKGISYISVIPNFKSTEGAQKLYFALLAGKEDPLDEKIRAFVSTNALAVASFFCRALGREVRGEDEPLVLAAQVRVAAALETARQGSRSGVKLVYGGRTLTLDRDGAEIGRTPGDFVTVTEADLRAYMALGAQAAPAAPGPLSADQIAAQAAALVAQLRGEGAPEKAEAEAEDRVIVAKGEAGPELEIHTKYFEDVDRLRAAPRGVRPFKNATPALLAELMAASRDDVLREIRRQLNDDKAFDAAGKITITNVRYFLSGGQKHVFAVTADVGGREVGFGWRLWYTDVNRDQAMTRETAEKEFEQLGRLSAIGSSAIIMSGIRHSKDMRLDDRLRSALEADGVTSMAFGDFVYGVPLHQVTFRNDRGTSSRDEFEKRWDEIYGDGVYTVMKTWLLTLDQGYGLSIDDMKPDNLVWNREPERNRKDKAVFIDLGIASDVSFDTLLRLVTDLIRLSGKNQGPDKPGMDRAVALQLIIRALDRFALEEASAPANAELRTVYRPALNKIARILTGSAKLVGEGGAEADIGRKTLADIYEMIQPGSRYALRTAAPQALQLAAPSSLFGRSMTAIVGGSPFLEEGVRTLIFSSWALDGGITGLLVFTPVFALLHALRYWREYAASYDYANPRAPPVTRFLSVLWATTALSLATSAVSLAVAHYLPQDLFFSVNFVQHSLINFLNLSISADTGLAPAALTGRGRVSDRQLTQTFLSIRGSLISNSAIAAANELFPDLPEGDRLKAFQERAMASLLDKKNILRQHPEIEKGWTAIAAPQNLGNFGQLSVASQEMALRFLLKHKDEDRTRMKEIMRRRLQMLWAAMLTHSDYDLRERLDSLLPIALPEAIEVKNVSRVVSKNRVNRSRTPERRNFLYKPEQIRAGGGTYNLLDIIGEGASAAVFNAMCVAGKSRGKMVVVKIQWIDPEMDEGLSDVQVLVFMLECLKMMNLRESPYIARLIDQGTFVADDNGVQRRFQFIVQEKADGGTLQGLINEAFKERFRKSLESDGAVRIAGKVDPTTIEETKRILSVLPKGFRDTLDRALMDVFVMPNQAPGPQNTDYMNALVWTVSRWKDDADRRKLDLTDASAQNVVKVRKYMARRIREFTKIAPYISENIPAGPNLYNDLDENLLSMLPAIFMKEKADNARIDIGVHESHMPAVFVGQKVLIEADYYPGVEFAGTVVGKSPVVDPALRTAWVSIMVEKADDRLEHDISASVSLISADGRGRPVIIRNVAEGRVNRSYGPYNPEYVNAMVSILEQWYGKASMLGGRFDDTSYQNHVDHLNGMEAIDAATTEKYADQVLEAAVDLEERGAVHGDIKPENTGLFGPEGNRAVKLIDLGSLSQRPPGAKVMLGISTFTRAFTPEETWQEYSRDGTITIGSHLDRYAFGKTLLWLRFGGRVQHMDKDEVVALLNRSEPFSFDRLYIATAIAPNAHLFRTLGILQTSLASYHYVTNEASQKCGKAVLEAVQAGISDGEIEGNKKLVTAWNEYWQDLKEELEDYDRDVTTPAAESEFRQTRQDRIDQYERIREELLAAVQQAEIAGDQKRAARIRRTLKRSERHLRTITKNLMKADPIRKYIESEIEKAERQLAKLGVPSVSLGTPPVDLNDLAAKVLGKIWVIGPLIVKLHEFMHALADGFRGAIEGAKYKPVSTTGMRGMFVALAPPATMFALSCATLYFGAPGLADALYGDFGFATVIRLVSLALSALFTLDTLANVTGAGSDLRAAIGALSPRPAVEPQAPAAPVAAPTAPAAEPVDVDEHNFAMLRSAEFNGYLGEQRMVAGDDGAQRLSANVVVDLEGRIVAIGNLQDMGSGIRAGLKDGPYSSVSFSVVMGGTPYPGVIEIFNTEFGDPMLREGMLSVAANETITSAVVRYNAAVVAEIAAAQGAAQFRRRDVIVNTYNGTTREVNRLLKGGRMAVLQKRRGGPTQERVVDEGEWAGLVAGGEAMLMRGMKWDNEKAVAILRRSGFRIFATPQMNAVMTLEGAVIGNINLIPPENRAEARTIVGYRELTPGSPEAALMDMCLRYEGRHGEIMRQAKVVRERGEAYDIAETALKTILHINLGSRLLPTEWLEVDDGEAMVSDIGRFGARGAIEAGNNTAAVSNLEDALDVIDYISDEKVIDVVADADNRKAMRSTFDELRRDIIALARSIEPGWTRRASAIPGAAPARPTVTVRVPSVGAASPTRTTVTVSEGAVQITANGVDINILLPKGQAAAVESTRATPAAPAAAPVAPAAPVAAPAAPAVPAPLAETHEAVRTLVGKVVSELRSGARPSLAGRIGGLTPQMESAFRNGSLAVIRIPAQGGGISYQVIRTEGGETIVGGAWSEIGLPERPSQIERERAFNAYTMWESAETLLPAGDPREAVVEFDRMFGAPYGITVRNGDSAGKVYYAIEILKLIPPLVLKSGFIREIDLDADRMGGTRIAHYDTENRTVGLTAKANAIDHHMTTGFLVHELGHAAEMALSPEQRTAFEDAYRKLRDANALFGVDFMGETPGERINYQAIGFTEFFAENFMHYVILGREGMLRLGKDAALTAELYGLYDGIFGARAAAPQAVAAVAVPAALSVVTAAAQAVAAQPAAPSIQPPVSSGTPQGGPEQGLGLAAGRVEGPAVAPAAPAAYRGYLQPGMEHMLSRGLDDLVELYPRLDNTLANLPAGSEILLVGPGFGFEILDIMKRYPDKKFKFTSRGLEDLFGRDSKDLIGRIAQRYYKGDKDALTKAAKDLEMLRSGFTQGDILQMPSSFRGRYDCVIVGNHVSDHIDDKAGLVESVYGSLKKGGVAFVELLPMIIAVEEIRFLTQARTANYRFEAEAAKRFFEDLQDSNGNKVFTVDIVGSVDPVVMINRVSDGAVKVPLQPYDAKSHQYLNTQLKPSLAPPIPETPVVAAPAVPAAVAPVAAPAATVPKAPAEIAAANPALAALGSDARVARVATVDGQPDTVEVFFGNNVPSLRVASRESGVERIVTRHIEATSAEMAVVAINIAAYLMAEHHWNESEFTPEVRAQIYDIAASAVRSHWVGGKRVANGDIPGNLMKELPAGMPAPLAAMKPDERADLLAKMHLGTWYGRALALGKEVPAVIKPVRTQVFAGDQAGRMSTVSADFATLDNRQQVVVAVVPVWRGRNPEASNGLNGALTRAGIGPMNASPKDSHIVTYEVVRPGAGVSAADAALRTRRNMEDAVRRAKMVQREQPIGSMTIFSAQIEGAPISEYLPEADAYENITTVVPDACTDLAAEENAYPDLMARVIMARHIAYWYMGGRSEAILKALTGYVAMLCDGEGPRITAVNGRIVFGGLLRIKRINFNELSDWQRMQEAIASSA